MSLQALLLLPEALQLPHWHIFLGRHYYEPVVRPALLTALLGYTFVVLGLLVDIGRSWAIWKPMFYWNPDSVLFEVAMCVMFYLTVLYIEFIPVVAEQFKDRINFPGLFSKLNTPISALLKFADAILGKLMWIFYYCRCRPLPACTSRAWVRLCSSPPQNFIPCGTRQSCRFFF